MADFFDYAFSFCSMVIKAFQIVLVFAAKSGIHCHYLQLNNEFTTITHYQYHFQTHLSDGRRII